MEHSFNILMIGENMRYKYDEIKRIKEAFLAGDTKYTSKISPMILASWKRSADYGVSPSAKILPRTVLDPKTLENISKKTKYVHAKLSPSMSHLWEILGDIGAVIFFLDSHYSTYAKGGDQQLLDELKTRNIKFSTCFSEELMGTNVISLSGTLRKPVWLIGHENYSAALADYACYGWTNTFQQDDMVTSYSLYGGLKSNSMVLIPLDKFTSLNRKIIEYAVLSNQGSEIISNSPDVYIKDKLLGESDNSCTILTDDEGTVISVSESFCSTFAVKPDDFLGYSMTEKLGDLIPYIEKALRGKTTVSSTLTTSMKNKKKGEFYIDCQPVYRQGQLVGTSTKMTSIDYVRKYVNTIVNYNARFTFDDIIGSSKKLARVKTLAQTAARSASDVLISGESGTGKEMFAQAIHNASARRKHPFVAINCAAIPNELVGSELFGYVEGAFTGAKRGGAMGKFEQANNGTIFLDEISEMSFDMQAALLRVLEERVVTRLGDKEPHAINVRVISASNRDLMQRVRENKFRLDLYYRLNVIHLDIPPLRERIEDIPELADSILGKLSAASGNNTTGISADAMSCLKKHSWPGNVRELRNVLESCMNIEQETTIQLHTLPPDVYKGNDSAMSVELPNQPVLARAKSSDYKGRAAASYEEIELEHVKQLMRQFGGNKSRVAQAMGISRGKVYRLLEKIGDWIY